MDVVTMGETMVAFAPVRTEAIRYAQRFEKRIAGAESNVAVGLAKLGRRAGWISRVGKDEFGEFILRELRGEGVDVSQVKRCAKLPTGLMFKQFSPSDETSVYYYRKGSAASALDPAELDATYIQSAKILHLSGITPALGDSCAATVRRTVELAKEKGVLLSFDPNFRRKLWDEKTAEAALRPLLEQSDIVLLGLEEAELFFHTRDPHVALEQLFRLGVRMAAVKLGAKGALAADRHGTVQIDPCPVKVEDNIGAGDAFDAGFLCGVLEGQSAEICGKMGGWMGALAVSSRGDTEGLPNREQLARLMDGEKTIYR